MVQADAVAFTPPEEVIGTRPLTVRRRVRWSDCDPAGVVHTARFGDYVLSAVDLFRAHLTGEAWHRDNHAAGFGTPAKALSLVFQSSLWPGDAFDIVVYVGDIRVRTLDLMMRARRADNGTPAFLARLTSICVSAADRRISMPWPEADRGRYEAYRTEHPTPQNFKDMGL